MRFRTLLMPALTLLAACNTRGIDPCFPYEFLIPEIDDWGCTAYLPSPETLHLADDDYYALIDPTDITRVSPNEFRHAGFKSRKEIAGFLRRVLKTNLPEDLNPRDYRIRVQAIAAACRHLGYYGSTEDAEQIFLAVQSIDSTWPNVLSYEFMHLSNSMMQALGTFLLRDHFMPQKDRTLMQEIEDYLYRCHSDRGILCWGKRELAYLRKSAEKAFYLGCSDFAKRRIAEIEMRLLQRSFGRYSLPLQDQRREMACTESRKDKVIRFFPPVLPEAEIDQRAPWER